MITKQKGKLVVLEGLDGSGKTVQFELLYSYLKAQGLPVVTVDFPNYTGSIFGRLVGRYLNGEFGDVYEVSPYVSSLFYAGDRLEAREQLNAWLSEGYWILANRYVSSNMAYHSAKLPPQGRPAFLDWLKKLEFDTNGLPPADLVIFLHTPVATAQRMIAQKATRSYTQATYDIHERNQHYLEEVSQQYLEFCKTEPTWHQQNVTSPNGEFLAPEIIQHALLQTLQSHGLIEF